MRCWKVVTVAARYSDVFVGRCARRQPIDRIAALFINKLIKLFIGYEQRESSFLISGTESRGVKQKRTYL